MICKDLFAMQYVCVGVCGGVFYIHKITEKILLILFDI